jgi:hypothetical protein
VTQFSTNIPAVKPPRLPELPSFTPPALPTLPSFAPPELPSVVPATQPVPLSQPERAERTDAIIQTSRAKTPAAAKEQRTNPRFTVNELNQMDMDEVRDRFLSMRYDNRTPVQKVFDLLDLPRNVIANLASGAVGSDIGKQQAQKGEYGALGIPKITTSDALRNMGVENRAALAIGGFVGDVAFDPLTYLGPAGWGAKAGKVALRAGGKRALREGVKAAAQGGLAAVRDDAVRGVLTAAGVTDDIRDAAEIGRRVYGPATSGKIGKAFSYIGGEEDFAGGVFNTLARKAKTADNVAEHASIDAVQNFISKYGRGTGGGIKIGQGGSEIAHIPFTDLTLQVPAFTQTANSTLAQLIRAKDARVAADVINETPETLSVLGKAKQRLDAMRQEVFDPTPTEMFGWTEAERMANVSFSLEKHADEISRIVREEGLQAIQGANPNTILHLGELHKEAGVLRDLANARAAIYAAEGSADSNDVANAYRLVIESAERYRGMIGGTLDSVLTSKEKGMVELAKQTLGTSLDQVGASVFGRMRVATDSMFGESSIPSQWLESVDRSYRPLFGAKGGTERAALADLQYRATGGASRDGIESMLSTQKSISELMSAKNVPASSVDDVTELAHLLAYEEAANRIGKKVGDVIPLSYVENGKLVRGERFNALKRLADTLKGVDPTFLDELRAIVANGVEDIARKGDVALEDFLINHQIPGFVPNVSTLQARAALRAKRAGGLAFEEHGLAAGSLPKEGFQKRRMSYVYQFRDPDNPGQWREFLEMDRALTTMGPEVLAAVAREDPKRAEKMAELLDSIKKYDALAAQGIAPPPKPADSHQLNKWFAEGRFGPLTIGSDKKFFETSWPVVVGQYTAMHERATARADAIKFLSRVSLPIDSREFTRIAGQAPVGTDFNLPGGGTGSIRTTSGRFGEQVPILYAHGQSWRPLSRKMSEYADNPLIASMWDVAGTRVLPETLADEMEKFAKAFSDENLNGLLRAVEKATGVFRTTTLALHPSWTIFDIVGSMANLAAGGVPLQRVMARLPDSIKAKMAEHNPARIAELAVDTPMGKLTGEDALRLFQKDSIAFDRNLPSAMGMNMMERGLWSLPSQTKPAGAIQDLKTDMEWMAETYGRSLTGAGAKAWGGARIAWDRLSRKVFVPAIRANSFVNDAMRGAALLALMDDGHDLASASDKLRRTMFDYHDMTHFERKYMRQVFPFYSWMRNNLPYQMHMLLQRPAFFSLAPKVQSALEEAIAGEQRVPIGLRPSWMRSQLAMQIGENPDSRFAFMLGNSIPQNELVNIMQGALGFDGAQDMLHYFGSSLNPILSAPLQIGGGQEYFSGRTIGESGKADMTIPEFAANMIRPVAEARKISDAAGRSGVEAAGRFLVGGRLQGFDQGRIESSRARELRDEAEGYRRAITKAQARGENSTVLRVKLLKTYEEAVRLGLGEEANVPQWARKTLDNLANTN